jgi:hypothetical protein
VLASYLQLKLFRGSPNGLLFKYVLQYVLSYILFRGGDGKVLAYILLPLASVRFSRQAKDVANACES